MAHIFNGALRRIYIDAADPVVSVKELYSQWKEWVTISDNAKYLQAFRTFGGDPTSAGQFAPAYYFLMNGWRVVVDGFDGNFSFNLYTEEGDEPVETLNGGTAYVNNSDIPQANSNSVDFSGFDYSALADAMGSSLSVTVDSADIADAVQDRFSVVNDHTTNEINNIQTIINSNNNQLLAISDKIDEIHHANFGRWFVDQNNNQLVIYQQDSTTEVARFNLYDENGNPTHSSATFDKVPV